VIRLGLRLTLNGGREAAVRLVITTVAVAIGAGMLLITLAGTNALHSQARRGGWHEAGRSAPSAGPLLWVSSIDEFEGQLIDRVDVAVVGPHAPVPPGPAQFYASPALTTLLRSTLAGELRDRFGRRQAGVIGPVALAAPNSAAISSAASEASMTRIRRIPVNIRVLTVPSGTPVSSAIWLWV
jgi:hypothetical protein